MTKQRKTVLEVLQNSEGHMRACDIYEAAKKKIPNISVGTVYRNLSVLADDGLICRIAMPDGADLFDKTPFPHGHMLCKECGFVKDIPSDKIKETILEMLDENEELVSFNLSAEFICSKCSVKKILG